jgi:hypothetical protein
VELEELASEDSAAARRVAGKSIDGNSITDSTAAASNVSRTSEVQESDRGSGLGLICQSQIFR